MMAISKFLDPKNDIAFRRIFGSEKNKDILIHFINDILGLQGMDQIQEITFQPTIQDPEIASKKQSIVDVLCKAVDGTQIIVEMQVSPQVGFAKRAQYYAAKAYARQLNKGQEVGSRYQDLKAVIFIAICNETIFKDKDAYISHHVILDQETYVKDLQDFSFTFIELSKFPIADVEDLTNIVEKWCYYFKYAPTTKESDLKKLVAQDQVIERAYEELNRFNWTEEELLIYEEEIKRTMDNLATQDYFINQGIKKGMEEGRKKGMEEGKKRGIEEGRKEGIQARNLELAKGMLKKGYDINVIQELTDLDEDNMKQLQQDLNL